MPEFYSQRNQVERIFPENEPCMSYVIWMKTLIWQNSFGQMNLFDRILPELKRFPSKIWVPPAYGCHLCVVISKTYKNFQYSNATMLQGVLGLWLDAGQKGALALYFTQLYWSTLHQTE